MLRAKGTDRLLDILETLETLAEPVSRNALARMLGCPRSTVYALVEQLADRNWIVQTEDGGIRLGHRAGLMGLAYARQSQFEQVARTMVVQIAVATGAVTEINVIDNWRQLVMMSATASGRNYLRTVEGSRYPLPLTGSARLQLAGVPKTLLRQKISDADLVLGSGLSLGFEAFCAEIEQAAQDGYFVATGLIDPYVATLGAPITNAEGDCLATLSIVLPEAELSLRRAELVETLRRGARELSDYLRAAPWPMGERARSALFEAN